MEGESRQALPLPNFLSISKEDADSTDSSIHKSQDVPPLGLAQGAVAEATERAKQTPAARPRGTAATSDRTPAANAARSKTIEDHRTVVMS